MRIFFTLVFMTLVGVMAVAWLWGRVVLRQTMSTGWPVPSGDLASIPKLYPSREPDVIARRLAEVEFKLTPDVQNRLREYVDSAAGHEAVHPLVPPPAIASLLDANAGRLRDIEDLLQGGTPEWHVDVNDDDDRYRLPPFAGAAFVHLFVALALQRTAQNDTAGAWRALRAASGIPEGLFRRPGTMSQTVAMLDTKLLVGTMRQVHGPPPAWALRWPDYDLTESLAHAAAAEAWQYHLELSKVLQKDPIGAAALYLRLSEVNTLAGDRKALRRFLRAPVCGQERLKDTTAEDTAHWNATLGFLEYNLEPAFRRLHRLNADIEGTRLLLAARQVRAATGAWPRIEPAVTTPCTPHLWSYTVDGSGDLRLKTKAPLLQLGYPTLTLSESFVEH